MRWVGGYVNFGFHEEEKRNLEEIPKYKKFSQGSSKTLYGRRCF
jgi:hypothetical protein